MDEQLTGMSHLPRRVARLAGADGRAGVAISGTQARSPAPSSSSSDSLPTSLNTSSSLPMPSLASLLAPPPLSSSSLLLLPSPSQSPPLLLSPSLSLSLPASVPGRVTPSTTPLPLPPSSLPLLPPQSVEGLPLLVMSTAPPRLVLTDPGTWHIMCQSVVSGVIPSSTLCLSTRHREDANRPQQCGRDGISTCKKDSETVAHVQMMTKVSL